MAVAPTILVVDNDEFDQMCFKRVWETLRFSNPVVYANDGLDALQKLRGEAGSDKIERPCVIFLDLDMPNMNGLKFLEVVRQDEGLRDLKIYIYSGSLQDDDIRKADMLGVSGFVLKEDIKGSLKEMLEDKQITFQLVA